jgi:hypothetical protein
VSILVSRIVAIVEAVFLQLVVMLLCKVGGSD